MIKEPYKYDYLIIKELDYDIKGKYNFQVFDNFK